MEIPVIYFCFGYQENKCIGTCISGSNDSLKLHGKIPDDLVQSYAIMFYLLVETLSIKGQHRKFFPTVF